MNDQNQIIIEPPKPKHGLSPERVKYLADHGITIRADAFVTYNTGMENVRKPKGLGKCSEVCNRIMAKARKLVKFTHVGLQEECKVTEGQAKNAIRRMVDRGEIFTAGTDSGHSAGRYGLAVYELKNNVQSKP